MLKDTETARLAYETARLATYAAYDAARAKDYAQAARLYAYAADTYPTKERKAIKRARSYAATYARAKGG